jgi:hypothetical protein
MNGSRQALLIFLAGCGFERANQPADLLAPADLGMAADLAVPVAYDLAMGEAAATGDSATCTPDCTNRSCGPDPVCSYSCGPCDPSTVCDSEASGAACVPPTIQWELDGTVIQRLGTAEAYHVVGSDSLGLYFPHWGRNVQISMANASTRSAGTYSSCPGGAVSGTTMGVITSDNGWASLDALPLAWKSLNFSSCGTISSGDTVQTLTLTFTTLSTTHVVGSYQVVVQGANARAGSTLKISGAFDLNPTPM